MKCYKCNGTGYYDIDNECPVCDGTGEVEQTNEEWFCGLSTEEKARTIIQKTIELRMARKWSERHIIEWLKQPHTEKE